MKINKILKIMDVIEEKTIPCDMNNNMKYYSVSKKEWINVLDMDIIHFIRVAFKYVPEDIFLQMETTKSINKR